MPHLSLRYWLAIGLLATLTVGVMALDAAGIIFKDNEPNQASAVHPPQALDPQTQLPKPVPAGAPSVSSLPPSVRSALERLLSDPALGETTGAIVTAAGDTSEVVFRHAADAPLVPASTLKLLTAQAVLTELPPEGRITTKVTWDGSQLTLIGSGDASMRSRDLQHLAATVRRRLPEDATKVGVSYDASLFSGPSISPAWEPTYVTTGVIAPVSALMVDDGRVTEGSTARVLDPAQAAARTFAAALEGRGVAVVGRVTSSEASATAQTLGRHLSPTILDLVEEMLRQSDNELAESLARLAALEAGRPGSFRGAVQTIRSAARSNGVPLDKASLFDASGLSRSNAVTATDLANALNASAATESNLRFVLEGLPVAGFDGTLADRFLTGGTKASAGMVRAKTGTLTGYSSAAGVVTPCGEGEPLSFAFLAAGVPDTVAARKVLDRAAAELTQCPR